ncbi:MAG: co-chaperone GroES [Verrucomicrobia bacterium]|nr:co-chaperone GroES [Verrucomicrobiota bacterium]
MSQKTAQKISLKPVGNRVVAKRTEDQTTTKGGIILPDTAKQKQETAIVVAVGSGITTKDGNIIPIPVSVGDTILMDKYAAQEVTVDDEEFIIVKADDIIAIVEN